MMSSRATLLTALCLGLLTTPLSCDRGSGKGDDSETGPGDSNPGDDSTPSWVDADGDGVTPADGDCDDEDPTVYPDRSEECNGKDDNCNGLTDEGFSDTDGDDAADCVDSEDCDGLDNDGDGAVDEDFGDADGDGIADCVGTEDCDGVDNDGDGDIDEGYDADGDGYTQCGTKSTGGTSDDLIDCDDADADINPGETETSGDLIDNNCDGIIDDGEWEAGDLIISEVMNNPQSVADTYGEWFEVYNASDRDLILNGLKILSSDGDETHTVAPPDDEILTISPGDYMVFGISDSMSKNGGVAVAYQYKGISLGNEADDLVLKMGSVTVDEVSWDGGSSFPDPDGATLTLDPGYIDADLNDDGKYWCAATLAWSPSTDLGSPGEDNELCTTFDHDFDGFSAADGDCDDWDSSIYPGAPEIDPSVDNDCDGATEWMPVADASYIFTESSLYTCDTLYLDGRGSHDQDAGGSIASYSWELTSAPADSATTTSDINETDDVSPTFVPDVDGDYTFTLTVNDGGTDSYPDSLTVPITTRPTNEKPVANAGSDQSYNDTVSCQAISYGAYYECDACAGTTITLSGSGSTDADGDSMTYSWAVTSATTGLTAELTDSDSSTASLALSGLEPTYGETSNALVILKLTTTDCMGATSTDEMHVAYTCTGD